jgi:phosphate transport system protein
MPGPRRLNDELRSLHRLLLAMSDVVDAQLADALNALVDHDGELAEAVAERDREVDAFELEIDRQCERLLALHAPVAADLRALIMAVKINTDLERIGDHCRNLARHTHHLPDAPGLMTSTTIPHMADLSRTMLRHVQEALAAQDRLLARKVIASDMQINRLHSDNLDALVAHAQECPEHAEASMHLMAASKALERIADHIKNIAGNIVFLVEGVDLRRLTRPSTRPDAPPAEL